jgi:hypothetical protein
MERTHAESLDSDRLRLGELKESITMKEWPGIPEWQGRFWLPDCCHVDPGGKNGSIRDDGGARQLFAESFAPGAARTDVSVYEDDTRFE